MLRLALALWFVTINAWQLQSFDIPTYALTVSIGGETNYIADHSQGRTEWVRELMRKLDEAAGSKKWGGLNWHPISVKKTS